jgi:hypothetical protein
MPDTREQYSHTLMDEAAVATGLDRKLQGVRIPRAEGGKEFYLKIMSGEMKG